jgi:hypothetical protein
MEASKAINPIIRDDVRGELVALLLARKGVPKGNWLSKEVRRLSSAEWRMLPDPHGMSADAPLTEDRCSILDFAKDESISSDPALLAEYAIERQADLEEEM